MSADDPFDPSLYTRAPILTIATGIALCQALADACPDSMPASVKDAKKQLHKVAKAAQSAWAERQRSLASAAEADTRPLDQEADASWGALRARLLAYADLPAERFPKARRAAEIVNLLFGADGLLFLREAYPVQWSTMDTLLARIKDENLAAEIDELAGPEFLKQIRHVHPRYGAMVKAVLAADATGPNLLDHVRAMQRAVVMYATRVCGTVDDEHPSTAALARSALAPIEQIRQAGASRRDSGDKPAEGQDKGAPPQTGGAPG